METSHTAHSRSRDTVSRHLLSGENLILGEQLVMDERTVQCRIIYFSLRF